MLVKILPREAVRKISNMFHVVFKAEFLTIKLSLTRGNCWANYLARHLISSFLTCVAGLMLHQRVAFLTLWSCLVQPTLPLALSLILLVIRRNPLMHRNSSLGQESCNMPAQGHCLCLVPTICPFIINDCHS